MQFGNFFDQLVAIGCQMNLDFSLIRDSALSVNEPQFFTPGSKGNDTVVLCLKALCKFAYGCPFSILVSFYMKEQKVLKIGNVKLAGNIFTEADETPQLISKIGKRFKLFFGKYFVNFNLR